MRPSSTLVLLPLTASALSIPRSTDSTTSAAAPYTTAQLNTILAADSVAKSVSHAVVPSSSQPSKREYPHDSLPPKPSHLNPADKKDPRSIQPQPGDEDVAPRPYTGRLPRSEGRVARASLESIAISKRSAEARPKSPEPTPFESVVIRDVNGDGGVQESENIKPGSRFAVRKRLAMAAKVVKRGLTNKAFPCQH